jgi:CRP/FNR family cyclic AMP-dependent transcriptional regulator
MKKQAAGAFKNAPIFYEEVPLFEGLTREAMATLLVASEEKLYTRGQTIVEEAEFGHHLYVIGRGAVEVVKSAGTPNEVVLAKLKAKDFFGEMCLIESTVRSATVRGLEPTLIYRISSATLHKFSRFWPDQHAALILNLTRDLSRRLRSLDVAFAARAY